MSVRTLINRYFTERKDFLHGTKDTISVVVNPIIADESSHRNYLLEAGITLVNSAIAINNIDIAEYTADVIVTETVTFAINGEVSQEEIIHTILVYENRNSN